ncbi:MAG: extracellular solute-binding protein [Leptolyngbyaceae cyanobacterium MO_188.B28]|nr:extracellular solute-binding protein [Leptolyngbyaceae cyanobacterium MO_188.B28]
MGRRDRFWASLLLATLAWMTGCDSNQFGQSGQPEKLTFWTPEVEPDRLAIQTTLTERFTAETGIEVEVAPIEEGELASRIVAAAAADALPDVLFLPLDLVITLSENGILDTEAATAAIAALGQETFAAGPLSLVAVEDKFAAVPTDGWGQLLLYRQDWFADNNLAEPNTWEAILTAAQTLHNAPELWSIEVGTDPTQTYTQQVFEQFALSNNCRLVDASGEVNLNTPQCVAVLDFYKQLASDYSPPGDIYWLQTRQDFQAGDTSMIIWSPFILDEVAGLRDDAPVTAELNPPLHERVGIVTAFAGPDSSPVQWGQVNYLGIAAGASADARRLVEFILAEENYLDWLAMAPEGKFPLRPQFVDGWRQLEIGVDRKAKVTDLYSDQVIDILISGVDNFDRWGFAAGKGACVGSIYGTQTVTQILRRYLDGEIETAADAAQQMTESIQRLEGCS